MKKLIVTRADEKIKEMTDITHPVLKKYAKKCNAEFEIISETKGIHPHYRILQLHDLFKEYDRILCIDSDVLILKKCPDLFNLVPAHKVASIFEDKGSRQKDRRERIAKIQKERGDIGWTEGYINSGVILFSKMHRDLFDIPEEELYLDLGYDDVLLSYRMFQRGYELYELPCEWNFMSMFTESWSNKKKLDAFIIHYAGNGFTGLIERTEQIKQDYLVLNKYNMI